MRFIFFLLSVFFCISAHAAVDVNQATADEIARALHGIGAKKAQAIIDYCHQNPCSQAEDLLNVKGIGKKTLEKIKADLIFPDAGQQRKD